MFGARGWLRTGRKKFRCFVAYGCHVHTHARACVHVASVGHEANGTEAPVALRQKPFSFEDDKDACDGDEIIQEISADAPLCIAACCQQQQQQQKTHDERIRKADRVCRTYGSTQSPEEAVPSAAAERPAGASGEFPGVGMLRKKRHRPEDLPTRRLNLFHGGESLMGATALSFGAEYLEAANWLPSSRRRVQLREMLIRFNGFH
ncbi:unnamed protein product [Lampetra planeri]